MKYIAAITALLLLTLYFFYNEKADRQDDLTINANSYIEEFRAVSKKKGAEIWTITAGRAEIGGDETTANLKFVVINIIKEGISVNADSGIFNMKTKEMLLKDNIRIRSANLEAAVKSLSWDPSAEMITTDDNILITGNKFKLEGDGLTATQENKLMLRKNVKATFY